MKNPVFVSVSNLILEMQVNTYWLTEVQDHIALHASQLCTQKEGFILDVLDVVVSNVRASPWGYLICTADCKVKHYLPQTGQVVVARVHKILLNTGVYCIYLKADLLIPWREVLAAERVLEENMMLECRISQVRYQNGKYRCIASLIK